MTYVPPVAATEDFYAGLPFDLAQAELGSTSTVPRSGVAAFCDWHATLIDAHRGSFAVVRRNGPLAGLLGQRVKVSAYPRSVYVYVTAVRDIEEDISLYRRAFLALALLSTERLAVRVEVMS